MKSILSAILLFPLIASASDSLPNILFVLSDDHSVPHIGCYGDPNVVTPNFDKFSAEGVRFTRAYTTATQCAPSRKSILTGRSPVALQQTLFTLPLQADAVLFPELLKKQKGYEHWPYDLYIRAARRMKGATIMTQKDITEDRDKKDVVHIGSS